MKTEMISSKNDYLIPCSHTLTGNEQKAVIIAHGFGSSKESPDGQDASRRTAKKGYWDSGL